MIGRRLDRVLGSAGRRPRVPVLEGSAPLVVAIAIMTLAARAAHARLVPEAPATEAEDRVRHRSDRGRQHRLRPRRRFPDQRRGPRSRCFTLRVAPGGRRLHHLQGEGRRAERVGQPLPGLLLPADGAALPARAPAAGAAAVVHARDDAAVLRPRQRVRGAARRDSGPRLLRPRASDAVHPAALGRSWATSSSSSAPPTPRTGSSSTRRARSPPT